MDHSILDSHNINESLSLWVLLGYFYGIIHFCLDYPAMFQIMAIRLGIEAWTYTTLLRICSLMVNGVAEQSKSFEFEWIDLDEYSNNFCLVEPLISDIEYMNR